MISSEKKIVIIGAGPCGLGAAWRLHELGASAYELFEQSGHAGGLSASFMDKKGFTWDIGGHIQFSHYDYFDRVMNTALPESQWLTHTRESWIWMRGRFIPYPLQYNIGQLPAQELRECLEGLEQCRAGSPAPEGAHFLDWIRHTFGDGIARHFLIPYNEKVWAYPLEKLAANWIGERVAVPDLHRIRENIKTGRVDCSWGPNSTFRFPLRGGTGAVWQAVADRLPPEKLHLHTALESWDPRKKILRLSDGREEHYDYLISTMPLTELLKLDRDGHYAAGRALMYSSLYVVGIGFKGAPPEKLRTKCWMYFPEDDNPFCRVTVFSNYSPGNVPPGGYWSLMGEISESPHKPVDRDGVVASALDGLYATGLIDRGASVASTWPYRAEYAYPTPFLGRDELLTGLLEKLRQQGVYSRGRFGAWKYECGNQDHAFMQGVEAVEHILFGTPELTLSHPRLINTHRVR